jgi:hypothetical protein
MELLFNKEFEPTTTRTPGDKSDYQNQRSHGDWVRESAAAAYAVVEDLGRGAGNELADHPHRVAEQEDMGAGIRGNRETADRTTPSNIVPDIIGGFFHNQQSVLSEWLSSEIQNVLKGTCKAVKERNQPCTTRGWFNAVVDEPFFNEK